MDGHHRHDEGVHILGARGVVGVVAVAAADAAANDIALVESPRDARGRRADGHHPRQAPAAVVVVVVGGGGGGGRGGGAGGDDKISPPEFVEDRACHGRVREQHAHTQTTNQGTELAAPT